MRLRVAAIAGVCFVACGEPTEMLPFPDASAGAGFDASTPMIDIAPPEMPAAPVIDEAAIVPAAPAAPAPPNFLPCPKGWRETVDHECEPWPITGREDCPIDQAHFPGEPGCAQLGDVCPATDAYATGLPANGVLYVQAGAPAGGDGTRATPFATIAEATAAAAGTATIALARGTYSEHVVLPAGVSLVGACIAETVLTSTLASTTAALVDAGDGSVIRNLMIAPIAQIGIDVAGVSARIRDITIRDTVRTAIWVRAGGSAAISDIAVEDAGAFGVLVEDGGRGELARAAFVDGTRSVLIAAGTGSFLHADRVSIARVPGIIEGPSRAIQAREGGTAILERSVAEEVSGVSIASESGALTLRDVILRDPIVAPSGDKFGGVSAGFGGRLELERVRVEDAVAIGLNASDGATAFVRDTILRDVERSPDLGAAAAAIIARRGGEVVLARVRIERAQDTGIVGLDGARVAASDLTIAETLGRSGTGNGGGVVMVYGTELELDRVLVDRCHVVGIASLGRSALLRDVAVVGLRDRLPLEARGSPQGAIYGAHGVAMTVERARVDDFPNYGVMLIGKNGAGVRTHGELTDVSISTSNSSTIGAAAGVKAYGAVAEVRRTVVERVDGIGVLIGDSIVTLEDVAIRETAIVGGNERGEAILMTRIGATATSTTDFGRPELELSRVIIERNYGSGILVNSEQRGPPKLVARDVIIRDTAGGEGEAQYGLFVYDDLELELERVSIERMRYGGIYFRFSHPSDVRTVAIRDLTIRDIMLAYASPPFEDLLVGGYGMNVEADELAAERVLIENVGTGGLQIFDGVMTFDDLTVRNVVPNADGDYGRILSSENTELTIRRAELEHGSEACMIILEDPATLEDIVCRDIKKTKCANALGCTFEAAGMGLSAANRGAVTMRRFLVTEIETAGVQVAPGGEVDLFEGIVSRNAIGANVQADGFDPNRLQRNGVFYIDNGVPLDAQSLPVPRGAPELGLD